MMKIICYPVYYSAVETATTHNEVRLRGLPDLVLVRAGGVCLYSRDF